MVEERFLRRKIMVSNLILGRSLMIGMIVGFAGWIVLSALAEFPDPGDTAALLSGLAANLEVSQIIGLISAVGFVTAIFSFIVLINKKLANTATARIGGGMLLFGAIGGVLEMGLMLGGAEAFADNNVIGHSLYSASQAIGSVTTFISAAGFILVGLTALRGGPMEKIPTIILGLAGVVGAIIILTVGYGGMAMMAFYIGTLVGLVWLGWVCSGETD
tara:strand:+ start:1872 stop:2522 length:651 start_codon:yes stop_codon:yes gene_type:complete